MTHIIKIPLEYIKLTSLASSDTIRLAVWDVINGICNGEWYITELKGIGQEIIENIKYISVKATYKTGKAKNKDFIMSSEYCPFPRI